MPRKYNTSGSNIHKSDIYNFFLPYYLDGTKVIRIVLDKLLPSAMILLYHRVDITRNDPHLLCVSPKNFYDQLKYLKERYRLVSLGQLVGELQKGLIKKNTVSVTFDDGYADNYYNVLPVLKQLKLPATFFISAGYVGKRRPFFWDVSNSNPNRGRSMTINELRKLSRSKFVEIGAHTVNHPRLSNEKPDVQEREILNSKQFLENILGSSVNGFSYPFGGKKDFDRQTMDLVKTAGYQYGVSTFAGRVYKFSNIYTLPRYVVRDWPIWDFQKKVDDFI